VDKTLTAIQAYTGGNFAELTFILLSAGAVFVFSLGVSAMVLTLTGPLRRRLGRLGPDEATNASRKRDFAALLGPVARYVLPAKDEERSRVSWMLVHAGYRSANALSFFYAGKALMLVGLPLLVFVSAPLFPKVATSVVLFYALVAALIGFLAPSTWLEHRVKSRQRELRNAFPDALDLLVVCVESGLGLAPALQRVAEELVISHPELGGELGLVNAEMRAGVERTQALKNLAERTGLDDIRGLVALLVQTMRFGTSVADALRVYSEEFRDRRMQAAEEQAAKIGTKMIFPLVGCLFPSFFLVAVGPAVIRIVEAFRQLGQ
jgi:tight adherence protein C